MRFGIKIIAALFLSMLSINQVFADQIDVKKNMARVLRVAQPASTVIVGNPNIVDVTVQDEFTLILTGKTSGITNLVALDENGAPIADTLVSVSNPTRNIVQKRAGTSSPILFACDPVCESTTTSSIGGSDNASAVADALR